MSDLRDKLARQIREILGEHNDDDESVLFLVSALIGKFDTLLSKKEALEQERRRHALDGQAALDEANNTIKSLQSEKEALEQENRALWLQNNVSPETAKTSSPAIVIAVQHEAEVRIKAMQSQLDSLESEKEALQADLLAVLKETEDFLFNLAKVVFTLSGYEGDDNEIAVLRNLADDLNGKTVTDVIDERDELRAEVEGLRDELKQMQIAALKYHDCIDLVYGHDKICRDAISLYFGTRHPLAVCKLEGIRESLGVERKIRFDFLHKQPPQEPNNG